MKPFQPILLAVPLLLTAFAGCSGEDEALKAAFVATPVDAEKTMFKFDAGTSTGSDLKFSWDFGDRTEPKEGQLVEHVYEFPNGAYQVTLTVTDGTGATQKVTQPVLTGNGQNQAPLLYLTVDKRRVVPEEEILFDASQSVDGDGDPLFFEWDFNAQLDEQALANMENLGWQAYGRFPAGKPAPASSGGNSTGNGTEGEGGSLLTPSGHNFAEELAKAQARLYKQLGWEQLHGGEPGAAEPRNAELDGQVEDTSPIQFFKYPSTAVYYVHVRVEDIKGEGQEGFIKISVDESVPPASNETTLKGQLKPAALQPLQGVVSQPDAQTYSVWPMRYEFPSASALTLAYTLQPEQGDKAVAVYVCGTNSYTDCSGGTPKAKLEKGDTGRSLTWNVGPDETLPFTYYVIVANEGNAVVDFEFPISSVFDTNPWAKDEAGFGGAHH